MSSNVGWKLEEEVFTLGILLCFQRSMLWVTFRGNSFFLARDPRTARKPSTNFEWPISAKMEFMLG